MQTKNHIHKANLCKGSKSIGLTAKQNSCKSVISNKELALRICKFSKLINNKTLYPILKWKRK